MNRSFLKYTLVFCVATFISVMVLRTGAIDKAELLYAVIIFTAFGSLVTRYVTVQMKSPEREDRSRVT
jgi:hypothetical protein